MNNLTICYLTNRKEPMLDWFSDSLAREKEASPADVRAMLLEVMVVDFWARQRVLVPSRPKFPMRVTPPKPTVWQGRFRLTHENYFAASNARNTGLCLARGDWIAYVDDLSVLMPGWLARIADAIAGGYAVAGAYRKVKNLRVSPDAQEITFDDHPAGHDHRWPHGSDTEAVPCGGGWLYGCSCALPVAALLSINGWPEEADGMGSEDYLTGMVLANAGVPLRYDRRMLTLESEEHHNLPGTVFKRSDKGISPKDKSHAIIERYASLKRFPQPFGDIETSRSELQATGHWPELAGPERDWFDGQFISEL
jgi:glycosyltransferase involved in cell wall biosynthesis